MAKYIYELSFEEMIERENTFMSLILPFIGNLMPTFILISFYHSFKKGEIFVLLSNMLGIKT